MRAMLCENLTCACATLSSLWACRIALVVALLILRSLAQPLSIWPCQIALVVVRCSFWDSSRNPLGTLGVSDCSLCGTVLILLLEDILCRDLGKKVFYRELVQRSCHRDLLERSCKETTCRDLVMTEKEVSRRDLANRSLTDILPRELL